MYIYIYIDRERYRDFPMLVTYVACGVARSLEVKNQAYRCTLIVHRNLYSGFVRVINSLLVVEGWKEVDL